MNLKQISIFLFSSTILIQAIASPMACIDVFGKKGTEKIYDQRILDTVYEHYKINDAHNLFVKLLLLSALKNLSIKKISQSSDIRLNVQKADQILQVIRRISEKEPLLISLDSPEVAWLKREVLTGEVSKIVNSYYKNTESENSRLIFSKILNNRAFQFLVNPTHLPRIADAKAPIDSILNMNEHILTQSYFKYGQHNIDTYRRFANVYAVSTSIILIYFLLDAQNETEEKINHAKIESLEKSLSNINEVFNVLDQEFERRGMYKQAPSNHLRAE